MKCISIFFILLVSLSVSTQAKNVNAALFLFIDFITMKVTSLKFLIVNVLDPLLNSIAQIIANNQKNNKINICY